MEGLVLHVGILTASDSAGSTIIAMAVSQL
jgi:hypothetical protein